MDALFAALLSREGECPRPVCCLPASTARAATLWVGKRWPPSGQLALTAINGPSHLASPSPSGGAPLALAPPRTYVRRRAHSSALSARAWCLAVLLPWTRSSSRLRRIRTQLTISLVSCKLLSCRQSRCGHRPTFPSLASVARLPEVPPVAARGPATQTGCPRVRLSVIGDLASPGRSGSPEISFLLAVPPYSCIPVLTEDSRPPRSDRRARD